MAPPPPSSSFPTPRALTARRVCLIASCTLPVFGIADVLVAHRFEPWSLAIRLMWAAALTAFGLSIPWLNARQYSAFLAVETALGGVFTVLIAVFADGLDSPLLAWSFALPLAIAVFIQDEIWAVTAGAASTMAAGLFALALHHASSHTLTVNALLYVASAVIAIYASAVYQRIQTSERSQEAARLLAVEKLAESERRRARSERLALVGQLAAGVAHEINNPVAAAMMSLSLMEQDPVLSEAGLRRVRLAQTSLDRVAQIVTDLRTYGRDGPDDTSPQDPHPAIEDAVRLSELRIKKVGRLEHQVDGALPQVRINARHLAQVLLNLLVNAADACEETLPMRQGVIRLHATAVDGAMEITVEDNGPGLPAELLSRLFEPFVSTKAERGTGLGLALAHEYVERMGGALSGENRAEGGARFRIRLPAARAPQ